MKRIISIILTALGSLPLFAQSEGEMRESPQSGEVLENLEEHKAVYRWGITAGLNMDFPGDWTKIERGQEIKISYGGNIGGVANFRWPSNWMLEGGLNLGYDHLKLDSSNPENGAMSLDRWSLSLPIAAGYLFPLTDEMDIAPLLGLEFTYSFSNHISKFPSRHNETAINSTQTQKGIWNPFNMGWGFGSELSEDRYAVSIMGYFGIINIIKRNQFMLKDPSYPLNVRISLKYFF